MVESVWQKSAQRYTRTGAQRPNFGLEGGVARTGIQVGNSTWQESVTMETDQASGGAR